MPPAVRTLRSQSYATVSNATMFGTLLFNLFKHPPIWTGNNRFIGAAQKDPNNRVCQVLL